VCSFDVWEGTIKQMCMNVHTVFWETEHCLLGERMETIPDEKLVLLIW